MSQRTILFALFCCLQASLSAETLKDVLARMDDSAASFTGITANINRVTYTAIIDVEDTEHGVMWMSRSGSKSRNIRMRIDFSQPNERSVAFQGRKAEIYYPKIKTVHEYNLSQHRALVDQFLLLGFGTSGRNLAEDYQLRLIDNPTVNGQLADHLELTPKSKKALEYLFKVELWLSNPGGYPIRQKFYWTSDNTTTITYSQIQLNPKLSDKEVTLQLPSGVKREFPQK